MSKQEETQANWDELKEVYKSTATVFTLSVNYLTETYNKYQDILKLTPNTKKVLDGAAETLQGFKKLLDGMLLLHIEKANEGDKDIFKGRDGTLLKFKSGPIPDDEKVEEIVLKTLLTYNSINANIYTTTKNAIACVVTDLEKEMNEMEDDEDKKHFLALIEKDKAVLESQENKEEPKGDENGNDENKQESN